MHLLGQNKHSVVLKNKLFMSEDFINKKFIIKTYPYIQQWVDGSSVRAGSNPVSSTFSLIDIQLIKK